MATLRYTVILEPEEGGGYHIYCPALPGCHSFGETTDEALANIRDAIEGYVVSLNNAGQPIPLAGWSPGEHLMSVQSGPLEGAMSQRGFAFVYCREPDGSYLALCPHEGKTISARADALADLEESARRAAAAHLRAAGTDVADEDVAVKLTPFRDGGRA